MIRKVFILFLGFVFLYTVNCRKAEKWDGVISFKDDFDGFDVKKDHWTYQESCEGKGRKDRNLECFVQSDDNVRVINGTLIIRALQKFTLDKALYSKPRNYTSAKLKTIGRVFSHGTFIISARMPKGKGLLPSISLMPSYPEYGDCKFEEIEIVQARGHKTSNLMFSASYGRRWNAILTKRIEKAFPGVDFSEDFHEFALVWKPLRIDWYVDGILVFTASTFYHSDWILSDESNVPCSADKSLFQYPLQLTLSMAVGGTLFEYDTPLTLNETLNWPKPTFEVDWVKVYQF